MTEYLKLQPGGKISLFKYNKDRCGEHRSKNKNGKYQIYRKATKELVQEFDTEKEQSNFFYDEVPLEHVFAHLRADFYIADGANLGDLLGAIDNDEDLTNLVSVLFPMYPTVASHPAHNFGESAEDLIIRHSGVLADGNFDVELDLGFTNTQNWDDETQISIDENFPIYEGDKCVAQMIYQPTLLDVLKALFGGGHEPIAFTKEGIFNAVGMPVEEPLTCLFAPCAVEEELTLGDIFKYVSEHELLQDVIAMYSWCSGIEEFHRAALLPLAKEDDDEKLWHLEIARYVSIYATKNGYFNYQPDFIGVGELSKDLVAHYKEHGLELPDSQTYGIGMTPPNELVHLPVHCETDMEFSFVNKQYKVVEKKKAKTFYTLLDLLDAIYFEISFYGGSPQEIQEVKEEVQGRIESIRENVDLLPPFVENLGEEESK